MDEQDLEDILVMALKEFAEANDLSIKAVTVKDKGFGTEPGLIVTVGAVEFHVAITQTVFEDT